MVLTYFDLLWSFLNLKSNYFCAAFKRAVILIFIKALHCHVPIEKKATMEDPMRKIVLALSAATVIAAGTVTTPTPSHANGVAVAAIVAGAVVATVFVVHAVAHPAYDGRHHRWHHRWHHRR